MSHEFSYIYFNLLITQLRLTFEGVMRTTRISPNKGIPYMFIMTVEPAWEYVHAKYISSLGSYMTTTPSGHRHVDKYRLEGRGMCVVNTFRYREAHWQDDDAVGRVHFAYRWNLFILFRPIAAFLKKPQSFCVDELDGWFASLEVIRSHTVT